MDRLNFLLVNRLDSELNKHGAIQYLVDLDTDVVSDLARHFLYSTYSNPYMTDQEILDCLNEDPPELYVMEAYQKLAQQFEAKAAITAEIVRLRTAKWLLKSAADRASDEKRRLIIKTGKRLRKERIKQEKLLNRQISQEKSRQQVLRLNRVLAGINSEMVFKAKESILGKMVEDGNSSEELSIYLYQVPDGQILKQVKSRLNNQVQAGVLNFDLFNIVKSGLLQILNAYARTSTYQFTDELIDMAKIAVLKDQSSEFVAEHIFYIHDYLPNLPTSIVRDEIKQMLKNGAKKDDLEALAISAIRVLIRQSLQFARYNSAVSERLSAPKPQFPTKSVRLGRSSPKVFGIDSLST